MSDYTISIPDSLYQKAQRVAKQTSQPVDDVIRTRLEGVLDQPMLDLPADERVELQAMSYLGDDTLWTIAREQMSELSWAEAVRRVHQRAGNRCEYCQTAIRRLGNGRAPAAASSVSCCWPQGPSPSIRSSPPSTRQPKRKIGQWHAAPWGFSE